jgi:hypothetical protein
MQEQQAWHWKSMESLAWTEILVCYGILFLNLTNDMHELFLID